MTFQNVIFPYVVFHILSMENLAHLFIRVYQKTVLVIKRKSYECGIKYREIFVRHLFISIALIDFFGNILPCHNNIGYLFFFLFGNGSCSIIPPYRLVFLTYVISYGLF